MKRERLSMPSISPEEIDPTQHVPEDVLEKQRERHGREDGLSKKILEWWKGDTHTHSSASSREDFGHAEGIYDVREMMAYYRGLGLEFVALTEHASNPQQPEAQTMESPVVQSLLAEAQAVREANETSDGEVAALSGVESSILFDENGEPTLDVPDEALDQLDVVIGSRHGIAKERNLDAIRASLLFAAEHPHVDVLGHMDRNIRMDYSWDLLRANMPEVDAFHQTMAAKQKEKAQAPAEEQAAIETELQTMYLLIKKVIGRIPLAAGDKQDERLPAWRSAFQQTEERYWQTMQETVDAMARNGKAMEINLNAPPSQRLVAMAAEAGIPFFLNFDAHDFSQFQREKTDLHRASKTAKEQWANAELPEEELETLRQYKLDRLTHGPGVRAIARLARWIQRLEGLGVTPDRVVNSSRENLLSFLTERRAKKTENLQLLAQREAGKL